MITCSFVFIYKDSDDLRDSSRDNVGFKRDPRQFNLPDDFMHVEYGWGSSFFKYIGKKTKTEAVNECSNIKPNSFTGKMHLPIPKFSEEMDFYRVLFDEPWLDVYRGSDTGLRSEKVLQSVNGDKYELIFYDDANKTIPLEFDEDGETIGTDQILKFDWIVTNEAEKQLSNSVTLTKNGTWSAPSESTHDAVCVFNVDIDCSKCHEDAFCRYEGFTSNEIECICPIQVEVINELLVIFIMTGKIFAVLTLIRESWKKKSKTRDHHRACFAEKKSRAQH